MTTNEVHEMIKQCTNDLNKRTELLEKINFNDFNLVDENIETCKKISASYSETALKFSILSRELPENSELQEIIKKIITVLNDGIRACNEILSLLNESNQLIQIINKMKH
ncbi:hypothetical protein PWA57_03895 [Lactobacillus johnsonii]|uniref:hypothetical protein n=1 Tax=Lactobacillus johnsonii TaxID=33959 RepID=UPI002B25A0E1|nr:hypothetical protein [Lactobacillus johnsonii]WPE31595.1 hypothetical protein PWA57_03895 [Lactobacillus johnsonii]